MIRLALLVLVLLPKVIMSETPPQKILEFRLVHEEKTPDSQEYKLVEMRNNERIEETLYLEKESLLPASPVSRAMGQPSQQRPGDWEVAIRLTDEAAQKMAEVTRKNIRRRLALLVDGQVITAPVIQSEIGAEVQITGTFTEAEVVNLAKRINKAGAKTQP